MLNEPQMNTDKWLIAKDPEINSGRRKAGDDTAIYFSGTLSGVEHLMNHR